MSQPNFLYCKLKYTIQILLFLVLLLSIALDTNAKGKTINYQCIGLSQFEIIGSSGVKEEMKTNTYEFINGTLQDLNNIKCDWQNPAITCESNFLNIRKLTINQQTNKITDFISGNKGFGQYIKRFNGNCTENQSIL